MTRMIFGREGKLAQALRWSERYTKTDMAYLARGGFWLTTAQGIAAVSSFGLAIAFARLVEPDIYGTYKYLLTILGILTLACLRGMDTVVTQASARGNDSTIIQAFAAKVRWGLLGSAVSLVIALYYGLHGNATMALSFAIAILFIPIMDSFGLYSSVLTGKRDFRTQAVIDGLSQIGVALALIATLLFFKNAVVIFAVYGFAWTLVRSIGFAKALKRYPPNGKFEAHAMSYGWHASLNNSIAVLIASLDSILVFHYLGATQLAVYAFAMAPVVQSKTLANVITTLATPKFAALRTESIRATVIHRSVILFLIGALIAAIYSALAPLLFELFFPRYMTSVLYSQVFSVTIALGLGSTLLNGVLNSRITLIPKARLYLWNIPAVILGLASLLLIKDFGIWGAIIGQILSSLTSAGVTLFLWHTVRQREHASD